MPDICRLLWSKNEIEVRYRPIAEDSGQIRAVGYYALEDAGRLIARLMEEGKEFESICIPVSPLLLTQEDFIDKVEDVITRFHIPSGKLALELDDTALSSVYLNVNITMQELAHLGVELVLNHFGSGCVPVTGILDLPVNTVKLERMFVWQLETNPSCAAIAGGLIQIAKNLNIHIIAEGVETENQLNTLNGYECEYQQGFYYAPTMEKETLIKVLGCTPEESRITVEEGKEKDGALRRIYKRKRPGFRSLPLILPGSGGRRRFPPSRTDRKLFAVSSGSFPVFLTTQALEASA